MIYNVRDATMQINLNYMNRENCALLRAFGATKPGWYYQSSADSEGRLIGPYAEVDDIFEFFPDAMRAYTDKGNWRGK